MATISSGIMFDSNAFNLKEIPLTAIRPEINGLLVSNEQAVCAFQTIRDQVIFTNKRLFVANVKGITGKKVAYFSYPFSKVQYFGIETAGLMDIDCELLLAFNGHFVTLVLTVAASDAKLGIDAIDLLVEGRAHACGTLLPDDMGLQLRPAAFH